MPSYWSASKVVSYWLNRRHKQWERWWYTGTVQALVAIDRIPQDFSLLEVLQRRWKHMHVHVVSGTQKRRCLPPQIDQSARLQRKKRKCLESVFKMPCKKKRSPVCVFKELADLRSRMTSYERPLMLTSISPSKKSFLCFGFTCRIKRELFQVRLHCKQKNILWPGGDWTYWCWFTNGHIA